jgi:hypothetical protein
MMTLPNLALLQTSLLPLKQRHTKKTERSALLPGRKAICHTLTCHQIAAANQD